MASKLRKANAVPTWDMRDAIENEKPIKWVIKGLLPKGTGTIVAGEPKTSFKSWIVTFLGMCVASGKPFLGFETLRRSVFWYTLEETVDDVFRRLCALSGRRKLWYDHPFYVRKGIQSLKALETEFKEVIKNGERREGLYVIDTMIQALQADSKVKNENDPIEMNRFVQKWREYAQELGATVIFIHHFRKLGDMKRGSTALDGAIDGWFDFFTTAEKGTIHIKWVMRNAASDESAFHVQFSIDEVGRQHVKIDQVPIPARSKKSMKPEERKNKDCELVQRFLSDQPAGAPKGLSKQHLHGALNPSGRGVITKVQLDVALQTLAEINVARQTNGGWRITEDERAKMACKGADDTTDTG